MPSVPENLYLDILLRLPVESLLRCKAVCKNWYALISSPNFVMSHLNLTTKKDSPILILGGYPLNSVKCIIGNDSSSVCEIEEIDYPFKSLSYDCLLLCSCNGLVCIRLADDAGHDFLCLWNPTTREYKQMPKPPNDLGSFNCFDFDGIHALGYDWKTDDYKFAIGVKPTWESTLFQVYSLSSNSWTTVKMIPYVFPSFPRAGVLVNGNIHWLAMARGSYVLFALDISDESYNVMQLSEGLSENKALCDMQLGVLEGCLCALVTSYVNQFKIGFEVWMMLDYGVQESWTKRYIIAHERINDDRLILMRFWSSKNGGILLHCCDSLFLYDPKHESGRELEIDYGVWTEEKYFESLVSLKSGTHVGEEHKTEESIET